MPSGLKRGKVSLCIIEGERGLEGVGRGEIRIGRRRRNWNAISRLNWGMRMQRFGGVVMPSGLKRGRFHCIL